MYYNNLNPLKSFKHCSFCGSINLSIKGEKALQCADCGFLYYINMSAATAVLIYDNEQRILFTIRGREPAKGLLDLPGGFIDLGETAENAIRREVMEELHVELSELTFYGTFPNKYLYEGVLYETLDIVFKATAKSLESIQADDDVTGFCFRHPEQVENEEIGLDSIKSIIQKLSEV